MSGVAVGSQSKVAAIGHDEPDETVGGSAPDGVEVELIVLLNSLVDRGFKFTESGTCDGLGSIDNIE